jgi:hypothetical protein
MKKELSPFINYAHIPFKSIKPTPSIFMTGFAWAHLTDLNMTDFRLRIMKSTFLSDIQKELIPLKNTVQIFESASYTTRFSLEAYRRRNAVMRDIFVNQLHFEEFDQHQLTAGKLDCLDGLHYGGVPRAMSVMIALNLMCKSPSSRTSREEKATV